MSETGDEAAKARWRGVTAKRIEHCAADAAERAKAQLAISQEALRALLLAHGGAMIGLFTFVGNAIGRNAPLHFDFHRLRWAFALFVAGFALDLVAYLMSFLSQDRAYYQSAHEVAIFEEALIQDEAADSSGLVDRINRQHVRYYAVGVAAAVTSMLLFVAGCGVALGGVME